MRVKAIIQEDFTNYKVPAMFIGCVSCDWKCCTEGGFSPSVCANSEWEKEPFVVIDDREIISRYITNPITMAIVFGLFEPFLQFDEIDSFIWRLRHYYKCNDDIVLYTGYYEDEIQHYIDSLSQRYKNIVVKFGRYIPEHEKHFDEVLGVWLASDNQYAKRIS